MLVAGRDVNLTSVGETHAVDQTTVTQKKKLLSTKTTTTRDRVEDTWAIGTTLSGQTVQVAAGRDLNTEAAQIAGTGDVLLAAVRDVHLDTGVNTHVEAHSKTVKQSGLFSGGGVGFTIGRRQTDTTADIEETSHTGSLIGSTEGRVDIVAGGDATITGSDVLSREGIGITGQNVTIQAAEDGTSVIERQKFRQAGLNVSLKGGAVDTALAVKSSLERASEVEDDRLAALYVAKAGQTLFSGGQAGMNSLKGAGDQFGDIGNAAKTQEGTGGKGMSLRIGIGASKSDSSMTYTSTQAAGSRIASEGDVVIRATGDEQGNGGDLSVIGSRVEGENVTLAAANDLVLRSLQETQEQIERNQASSGEIGITIGSEAGIGVYVSASMAKGKGDGHGITHAETTVEASDTLTLVSGRDTTLEGAQALGERVVVQVGRDLTLTSQQDSDTYARKDMSAGIDVAVGTGGGSVSASYNQSKIDSDYTSVKEQTGIQAGRGGYEITVGGHTQLTGAAIASTADASLNRLETGSLGWSDLENTAAYSASSMGASFSGGSSGGAGFSNGFSGTGSPSVGVSQHEKASSTTQSGIADGTLIVHDGSGTDIARGVTELQQEGLKEIFDAQKVAERMEMGQVAGEVAFTAARDLISYQRDQAEADAKTAQTALLAAEGDVEATEAAKLQLADANQRLSQWNDGGAYKQTTQALAGVLTAAAGGGDVLGAVSGVMMNEQLLSRFSTYLQQKGSDPDSGTHDTLMNLMGVVFGAAGGALGGDTSTGAAVGSVAQQFGYYDYRDGRAHRQEVAAQALAGMGITDDATVAGVNALLDNCVKLGCDPSQLNLLLQSPDAAQVMTSLAKPETTAYAMYGKGFNELSQAEQEAVIARLGTGTVSVSWIEDLTSDGSRQEMKPVPQGEAPSDEQVGLRQQFGTVLSGLVITGGEKVEQVTNWLGEENAQTAALLLIAALGGPVKTGASYVFESSSIGQSLQSAKDEYLTKPLSNNIVSPYGFGAETDSDRQNVQPASMAVSTMMVDAILSALGIQGAKAGAKGVVTAGGGFKKKVDAADAAPKGQTLVIPKEKAEFLDNYKKAAEEGTLVRTDPSTVRGSGFRRKLEREQGPAPGKGYDADHKVELCVGGKDCAATNGQWLESRRNRSSGSKLKNNVKDDPIGTRYTDVIIEGDGD